MLLVMNCVLLVMFSFERDHDAVLCIIDNFSYCCHCSVHVVRVICIYYVMFFILLHVSVFVTNVTEFFVCYLMEAHAAQRHIALAACKSAKVQKTNCA